MSLHIPKTLHKVIEANVNVSPISSACDTLRLIYMKTILVVASVASWLTAKLS